MTTRLSSGTRGDFAVLHFMQHVAETDTGLPAYFRRDFAFARCSERAFEIDDEPVGPAYITLQFYDFEQSKHELLINGKRLPMWDVPGQKLQRSWFTWTEVVPAGYLHEGRNLLTIRALDGEGRFLIRDVFVHWHEAAPA